MSNIQAPSLANIPRPSGPWAYADPEEGYEYMASVEPNMMSYIDDDGEKHEIHIPTGRGAEACEHCANKSWSELAKFPKWGKPSFVTRVRHVRVNSYLIRRP